LAELQKEDMVESILNLDTENQLAAMGDIEKWDRAPTQAKLEVECQCQTLKTGRVDWCPLITQMIHTIQYWKGLAKQWVGCVILNNILQTWAGKAHLKHVAHGSGPMLTQIKQWLNTVYAMFKCLTRQQDWRDTWLGEIIVAQAEAQGYCCSQL